MARGKKRARRKAAEYAMAKKGLMNAADGSYRPIGQMPDDGMKAGYKAGYRIGG